MTRITMKELEGLVLQINQLTGSPIEPYTQVDGKLKANVGHYHLDQAYGGIKLVRLVNEGGGITLISRNGYGTKKELYTWMQAFIAGLQSQVAS